MERRQFLRIGGAVGLSSGVAGCVSEFAPRRTGIEVHEFEVLNVGDEAHTFDVSVYVVGEAETYERTVELSGASDTTFTREVLSDAPDASVAEVRVAVGDQHAQENLTKYDEEVAIVSARYGRTGEIGVVVFP